MMGGGHNTSDYVSGRMGCEWNTKGHRSIRSRYGVRSMPRR